MGNLLNCSFQTGVFLQAHMLKKTSEIEGCSLTFFMGLPASTVNSNCEGFDMWVLTNNLTTTLRNVDVLLSPSRFVKV